MKNGEIKVGGKYRAKVNGKLTTVQVNKVTIFQSRFSPTCRFRRVFEVTNLETGRQTTFRSAAKFVGLVELRRD